jgi:hypothetical protein
VSARSKPPSGLKTLSHLARARRVPTDYEFLTTELLWYRRFGGFEVDVPLADWYARHQRDAGLRCDDWERFVDPRETTYAKYVATGRAREDYADGVMRAIERGGYDASLAPDWLRVLGRLLPVLRFPSHALQMLAAYVGQMAPSGRIVAAAAFQTADQLRRVHRVTERTVQVRRAHPGFGTAAASVWERDPAWQPLREACERALVAWDWGEAFVASNLCIGPLLDELVLTRTPEVARRRGDPMLGVYFASFEEDGAWHRDWARALVQLALAASDENRRVLDAWLACWLPRARSAARALDAALAPDSVFDAAAAAHAAWLSSMGLEVQ